MRSVGTGGAAALGEGAGLGLGWRRRRASGTRFWRRRRTEGSRWFWAASRGAGTGTAWLSGSGGRGLAGHVAGARSRRLRPRNSLSVALVKPWSLHPASPHYPPAVRQGCGRRTARGNAAAAGRVDGRKLRTRVGGAARQGPAAAGAGAFRSHFRATGALAAAAFSVVSRVKGPTPPPAGLHWGPWLDRSTVSDSHGSWKRPWTILRGWRGASCRSAAPLGLRSSGASAKGGLSALYDDRGAVEAPSDNGLELGGPPRAPLPGRPLSPALLPPRRRRQAAAGSPGLAARPRAVITPRLGPSHWARRALRTAPRGAQQAQHKPRRRPRVCPVTPRPGLSEQLARLELA